MFKKGLIGLWLFIIGCGFPHPSLLPPYSIGSSLDIYELKKEAGSYNLYFSGPVYNPAAILFLKKDLSAEVVLHKDWKKIENVNKFSELMTRINYIEPYLYALVVPGRGPIQVVGYVYTPGVTCLKKIGDNKYFLFSVEEKFNDIYYGGDDIYRINNYY